jgi:hypothetical protein
MAYNHFRWLMITSIAIIVYDCSWFIVCLRSNLEYGNILELVSKLRPIIVLKEIYLRQDLLGHDFASHTFYAKKGVNHLKLTVLVMVP